MVLELIIGGLAGIAGAALYNGIKERKNAQKEVTNYVVYYQQPQKPAISYNKQKTDFDRVQNFLKAYYSLSKECEACFGKDKYNPVKKLASAIKFNSPYDDTTAKNVYSALFEVVELRNTYIGHNQFGIGAIPNDNYVKFIYSMKSALNKNSYEFKRAYNTFVAYKRRKLTYR